MRVINRALAVWVVLSCVWLSACSSEPASGPAGEAPATQASPPPASAVPARVNADSLKESFAKQLATTPMVRDLERRGDDLLFEGPGPKVGTTAKWRIHIDSVAIEPSGDSRTPYRGVVKSSWYANDQLVQPDMSARQSNLPVPLTSTGLAQDCWALWDPERDAWGW